MTPKAEAFLAALTLLCGQHHIALSLGGDIDEPRCTLGDLLPGVAPFSAYAFFEDRTDDDIAYEAPPYA